MNNASKISRIILTGILATMISFSLVESTLAHCDSINGPVITDAKTALEKSDVTPILKWISKENETEIKTAFAQVLAVRVKGIEAKELADRYFFETLVRLHRAGEGAPYTGIKDEPVEPIIALADKALEDGSAKKMLEEINSHMSDGIRIKFEKAVEAKLDKNKSVEAGREFVEAYVTYVHYIEALHSAIMSVDTHHSEAEQSADLHAK